jgi:hypothetical protein
MRKIVRWMAGTAAATFMIVTVASPAQAAPTVQARWDMDEAPIMVDSAGGDNNGTATAITVVSGTYDFNGATSIASAPHTPNLNPLTANVVLETRIFADTAPVPGETYDLMRKGISSTAGGYYKIELRGKSGGGMTAACIFKDRQKVVGTAIGSVPVMQWVTITCTKTATSVTLVAGGTKRTTARVVGEIANTSPVYLGGKGDATDVFDGRMDYASITTG